MSTIQINTPEISQKLNQLLSASDWYPALKPFVSSSDFDDIIDQLSNEVMSGKRFTPKMKNVFNAFHKCKLDNLKVVIIGQDPYPMLNRIPNGHETVADGMAFSCSHTMKEQPSLTKIFDAIKNNSNDKLYERNPDLTRWANQGVLLLNNALTTRLDKPGTHYDIWKPFLSFVLDYLYWNKPDLVFILMGKVAQEWEDMINYSNSLVINTSHPVSASYNKTDWDCKDCFNRANNFLKEHDKEPIIW